MSYTVADLDRIALGEFEIPWEIGTISGIMTEEDGSLYELLKWREIEDYDSPLGVISYVADYGGEGGGDDYWVVIKITAPDGSERWFKRLGWYASHCGGELDGPTVEVRPREKMVTVYEA